MTDEINVDEVMRKSTELEEAFRNFQVAHEVFHCRVENQRQLRSLAVTMRRSRTKSSN